MESTTIMCLPNDNLIQVISEMILQGDYVRAVAVSQKWEILARDAFFTLVPHFRARMFEPLSSHDDSRRPSIEARFGLPMIRINPRMCDGSRAITIPGCTRIVKLHLHSIPRGSFGDLGIRLRAPFGNLTISFLDRKCLSPACYPEKVCCITRIQGDAAAMERYLRALFPSLGRSSEIRPTQDHRSPSLVSYNLHSSLDCLTCEWRVIPGYNRHKDSEAGFHDFLAGLKPDLIDNNDYMSGYTETSDMMVIALR